jgi:signal transduction histidine kinase/ActR/RegA family two-component response regulator
MCLFFIITGSAAAFYLLRYKRIKYQKRQLEQKVYEQTAQLLTSNSQLLTSVKEERKARQEADQANRSKGAFLATMSHEIRTPMNGVIGMASLLMQTEQTSEQKGYTKTITTCGESLLSVINGILDFSKIESGNMELENRLFDLQRCIEDALDIFSFKASEEGIILAYHINSNVPTQINGDSLRLRQILINLVGNALKFTSEGEVFIGVRSVKTEGGSPLKLAFNVRDTGIGIPADKIGRLFKAFSQVDSSTTRKYGGTGLGLVICEKLVKLMGGNIEVESEHGKGTTFTFTIQTTGVREADATGSNTRLVYTKNGFKDRPIKDQKLTTEFAKRYPLRILVAEDNPINEVIVNNILSKLGYKPTNAKNGQEALDALGLQEFDMVFMDVQMPEMDGLEATRIIRKTNHLQPIIVAMTANAMQGDRDECLNAGMNDYLSKPLNLDDLLNLLKKWGEEVSVT